MTTLGINAYHGDVSAALLSGGALVAAVEEERFSRIKHTAGVPRAAVAACLRLAGIHGSDVEHVAVSRNPRAHALRKIAFAVRNRPGGIGNRARNSLSVARLPAVLAAEDVRPRKVHWIEHHDAHLASSFYVSGFDQAAVCAIDGFGDFVSTSWGRGRGTRFGISRRVYFPHSLGLLYLAITQFLGFSKYGDEYKVMGLAPYGERSFVTKIRELIRLHRQGTFELNLDYFCHHTSGVAMSWDSGEPTISRVFTPKLAELLGPPRDPGDPLNARHEALAASLQVVFEETAFNVLRAVHRDTGQKNLCLAGGCAMNSVMNGKIRECTPFENVYIQPAAGDNGTALGAALYVQHHRLGRPRDFVMDHAYWGPEFFEADVAKAVEGRRAALTAAQCEDLSFKTVRDVCDWSARHIAEGKVLGWFQGRMEWGARALGNRSIIADPRRADMREIINTKIKFRERFRPFAPSIQEEALGDYFIGAVPDPFMIQVYPVAPAKRSVIPAVTHVDGSGRLQTVSQSTNPTYWRLIESFRELTSVPVVLNTSFNENEPIVLRPEEALDCFLRTDMDVLVMGQRALTKPTSR
jgi:carbamoyltransferase